MDSACLWIFTIFIRAKFPDEKKKIEDGAVALYTAASIAGSGADSLQTLLGADSLSEVWVVCTGKKQL